MSEKQKEEEICVADRCRLQDIYVDSGCSGTTFRRPQFQRMLEDAQEGKINCIVCKDASRIGRDYLRTGEYLEKIFPLMGVRVICVSDGYDSGREMPGSLAGNLKNLMNEWYAKDIEATIVCERDSHKGIIIGKGGAMLKKIGSAARYEIERQLDAKVNLRLWVKVKKDWRDSDFLMKNFGYDKKEV